MEGDAGFLHFFFVIRWLGDSNQLRDVMLLAFFQVQVQVGLLRGIHDEEPEVLPLNQSGLTGEAE